MKAICVIAALLFLAACTTPQTVSTQPTQQAAPQTAKAPAPTPPNATSWRDEKIPFPPTFAPNLRYHGDLIVKFHPQWRQFDAPEGFSYVFHWVIEPADVSDSALKQALADYFGGLMTLVGESRSITAQGGFTPPRITLSQDANTLRGAVATWNAFNRGEALNLNMESTKRSCANGRTQISFALSKLPLDAAIWRELRVVRDAPQC